MSGRNEGFGNRDFMSSILHSSRVNHQDAFVKLFLRPDKITCNMEMFVIWFR